MAVKKFLDANGVTYLASLLDNYPDNEILGTVISAIQDALDEKTDKKIVHFTFLERDADENLYLTSDLTYSEIFALLNEQIPVYAIYGRDFAGWTWTWDRGTSDLQCHGFSCNGAVYLMPNDYRNENNKWRLYISDYVRQYEVTDAVAQALASYTYTETDPTVPAWAKANTKPSYTASEVGAVPGSVTSGNHNSSITVSATALTLSHDNDADPTAEITLNDYGITLQVASRSGYNTMVIGPSTTTIPNVSTPSNDTDAANKQYVDNKTTIKTTAASDNTEYNLLGTLTTNNNTTAATVYQQTPLSFSKTTTLSRLTIGSTSLPGHIRLYSNVTNAQGYTDLVSGATGTNARTITLPDASGTIALTSDIPSVPAWALAATKPTYTAAEIGATTTSDVSSMISSAVSGITSFSTEIVQTLPSTGVTGRIYFLSSNIGTNNVYEEYIYVNNGWEKLGNFDASQIDLTDYLKKTDLASWAKASTKPTYTASEVGALPSNTSYVSSFNGSSGAITYIPPVTSVNGQTGAVTLTIPAAYDDTALAARVTALEAIPWVTYHTGNTTPNSSFGNNGDLFLETN